MISKARLKYIKSLQVKKYRKQEQCFVVEGAKGVRELLGSGWDTRVIVATDEFLNASQQLINRSRAEIIVAKQSELEQLGTFQSNDSALAVARMQSNDAPAIGPEEFALVLDDIRDPGNLGTIIRTADWYGVKHIIASAETADFYNPKTISATMGSFTRVTVYYTDLREYIQMSEAVTYGAFLEGEDVHGVNFHGGGLIVIGNESAGISAPLEKLIRNRITIPRTGRAESLNVSIAAAIILDNVMRSRIL
jgi:TrmH family RNA methyltransferase